MAGIRLSPTGSQTRRSQGAETHSISGHSRQTGEDSALKHRKPNPGSKTHLSTFLSCTL